MKLKTDFKGNAPFEMSGAFLRDFGFVMLHIGVNESEIARKAYLSTKKFPNVIENLALQLGMRYSRMGMLELYNAGSWKLERNRSGYEIMLSQLLSDDWINHLFSRYEALELLPQYIVRYCEAALSIVRLYENDSTLLILNGLLREKVQIIDIEPKGDFHLEGFSAIVHFGDGSKLAFKNHSVGNCQFLTEVYGLARIDSQFNSVPLAFGNSRYYWQEYIVEDPAGRLGNQYYESIGGLLAVANRFGIRDLHAENIINSKGSAKAIDFECLAMPMLETTRDSVIRYGYSALIDSGILPQKNGFVGFREKVDWSVLGGDLTYMPSWGAHRLVDDGLPTVRLEILSEGNLQHIPQPAKSHIEQNDIDSIVNGYRYVTERLGTLSNEVLNSLARDCCTKHRVILRPTQVYANCLRRVSYPKYLLNVAKGRAAIEKILLENTGSLSKQIVLAEADALEQGCIPAFHVNFSDTSLYGTGIISASEILDLQIEDSEIKNSNIHYIEQVLHANSGMHLELPKIESKSKTTFWTEEQLVDHLNFAVEQIINNAWQRGNRVEWQNLTKSADGEYLVTSSGQGLYQGSSGVYIALRAATLCNEVNTIDKINFLDELRQSIEDDYFDQNSFNLGFFTGKAGQAFALLHGANLAESEDILSHLLSLIIGNTDLNDFDILSGAAGVLKFISECKIFKRLNKKCLKVEDWLVDCILDARKYDQEGRVYWAENEDWIGGLAHGPLGIAWSLASSNRAQKIKTTILEAVESQYSLFSRSNQEWLRYAKTKEKVNMSAWCHGGEGHYYVLRDLYKTGFSEVFNYFNFEKFNLENYAVPRDATLCHGLAGKCLFLQSIGDPGYSYATNLIYDYLCATLNTSKINSESLMVGRSGIVFAVAKTFLGERIGNPLLIELPKQWSNYAI